MTEHQPIGLPPAVRLLMKPLSLLPLGSVLSLAVQRLAARRPGVFERIGPYRTWRYRIQPSDLDFDFLLVPDGTRARIDTIPRRARVASDVQITGPLVELLGLLDGTLDGDALFFTRTISVRGRTDAVVALRNAIEDAELKPADLLGLTGRAGTAADAVVLKAIDILRQLAKPPSATDADGSNAALPPFGSLL